MEIYPEIIPIIEFRIGKIKEDFFKQQYLRFNGWNEFLSVINEEYNKRKRL